MYKVEKYIIISEGVLIRNVVFFYKDILWPAGNILADNSSSRQALASSLEQCPPTDTRFNLLVKYLHPFRRTPLSGVNSPP